MVHARHAIAFRHTTRKIITRRKIQERTIFQEDIVNFDEIKIINAMNGL